jgi:hypothetical protein
MMTFRRMSFAVSALVFGLAAGVAAHAGTLGGSLGGTNNSITATNLAAGIGNHARQGIFAQQFGQMPSYGQTPAYGQPPSYGQTPSYGPQYGTPAMGGGLMGGRLPSLAGPGSNSVNANNIAAGIGNTARQGIDAVQGPGGFNRLDANNIAAGIGNSATQEIFSSQQ